MHFYQKAFEDVLCIEVTVCFDFPAGLFLVEQFMSSLSFEFEEAVHEFVDCVYFDDEKFFIEDFIVFGVYEA